MNVKSKKMISSEKTRKARKESVFMQSEDKMHSGIPHPLLVLQVLGTK